MFRYYLLRGDTAAPSGLYARLCHAFLVSVSSVVHLKKDLMFILREIFCTCHRWPWMFCPLLITVRCVIITSGFTDGVKSRYTCKSHKLKFILRSETSLPSYQL